MTMDMIVFHMLPGVFTGKPCQAVRKVAPGRHVTDVEIVEMCFFNGMNLPAFGRKGALLVARGSNQLSRCRLFQAIQKLRYGEEKGEEVLKSRWKNSRFNPHELWVKCQSTLHCSAKRSWSTGFEVQMLKVDWRAKPAVVARRCLGI